MNGWAERPGGWLRTHSMVFAAVMWTSGVLFGIGLHIIIESVR